MARYRPETICMLVGWNDGWSRPAQVDPATISAGGFPWRWRTGRLLALARAQWQASVEPAPQLPFLGTWHVRGESLHFAADGTARLGPLAASWAIAGSDLRITPVGGAPFLVRWREWEGGIEFALHGWDRFHRARRGELDGDGVPPEFAEAIDVGDLVHAQRLATAPGSGIAMQARLCVALLEAGRRADAQVLQERLQAAWQDRRDSVAGEALAQWCAATDEPNAAAALAEQVVAAATERIACWRILVDHGAVADRRALAARLAVATSAQTSPWRRAELTAEQAVLVATWDPASAIELLLAARELGIGQDESVAVLMRMVRLGVDGQALLTAAEASSVRRSERDVFVRVVRRAAVSETEMVAVLMAHLRLFVERCRATGATPVLVGYPFPLPSCEAAARQVAAAMDVPFVSTFATFAARMAGTPRADWFVDEIHCTARGYELLAEVVGARLLELRKR
jgi:hypothetical protein